MADHVDEDPPSYSVAERRMFGLTPTTSVAVLAFVALALAAVMFAASQVIAGVLLLLGGGLLAALYIEQALRRRDSRLDRGTAVAIERSRAFAGFAGACARAWTGAGSHVTRARVETTRLARERSKLQHELGAAAYAANEPETERLRSEMRELDRRIEEAERAARDAVEGAKRRTRREKLAVASTEIRKP